MCVWRLNVGAEDAEKNEEKNHPGVKAQVI